MCESNIIKRNGKAEIQIAEDIDFIKVVAGGKLLIRTILGEEKYIEGEIDEGKYDREILSEAVITESDKRLKLDKYYSEVKAEQDRILQQEAAAAAAEKTEGETAAEGTATVPE